MNISYRMTVGVNALHCELKPCIYTPHVKAKLIIDFELEGDFMSAAKRDDLNKTIDYDLLSQHIRAHVIELSCLDSAQIHVFVAQAIRNFSPLISGGFLKSSLICHTIFRNECTLLYSKLP